MLCFMGGPTQDLVTNAYLVMFKVINTLSYIFIGGGGGGGGGVFLSELYNRSVPLCADWLKWIVECSWSVCFL